MSLATLTPTMPRVKLSPDGTEVFILIDIKSEGKHFHKVVTKDKNGEAFAEIVARNGIHKFSYKCTIYTDGCGSMVHVVHAAVRMGLNHVYIPPHEQSLNEAEKVAYRMWDNALALMVQAKAPMAWFEYALEYAFYVDWRTATNEPRGHRTPFEIVHGRQPKITLIPLGGV